MASDEGYIFEQLEADPEAIHEASMQRLVELLPDWKQRDTALEVLVDRARADQTALLVDVMSDVLASIMNQVLLTVGIPRDAPGLATGVITVTTDGLETYLLPAGATMTGYLPDQSAVTWITTIETVVPAGSTTATGVPVAATMEGRLEGFEGFKGPQQLDPDQAYNWLQGVTLDVVLDVGSDGEDDESYLARGSERLVLLADQIIRPEDAARYVSGIPGVGRVLVLNLVDSTNPALPTRPVDRCVTVVATDPDGLGPTTELLDKVRAELMARREVNFRFFVQPPTYFGAAIKLKVAAFDDAFEDAGPRVEQAIRDWLSPMRWGAREAAGSWEPSSTVRIGELVAVADAVPGVDYVNPADVLIDGQNRDKKLIAPLAALPDPARTTVTVEVVRREP